MTTESYGDHIPVLLPEVLEGIELTEGDSVVDGTLGAGHYTQALLQEVGETGCVISFDLDEEAIRHAESVFAEEIQQQRLHLVHAPFDDWSTIRAQLDGRPLAAAVFDLGLSTHQLTHAKRGFSFLEDETGLDMRFNAGQTSAAPKAQELLNTWSQEALADLFFQNGELRNARVLAKEVVQRRPFVTVQDLVNAALAAKKGSERKESYLAKVFQALRIEVNDELRRLERGLEQAVEHLAPEGRLAVVSYHSLEDRRVKQLFKDWSKDCSCLPEAPICTCETTPLLTRLTSSAITPSDEERERNPRSRSARLRIAKRLATTSE